MGFLDSISNLLNPVAQGIVNFKNAADQGIHNFLNIPMSQDLSRGQISGNAFASGPSQNYSPTPNFSSTSGNQQYVTPGGQVSTNIPGGSSGGGSNGGSTGGSTQPTQQPNQTGNTQDQYNAYMDSLRNTFDERAAQLKDQLGGLDTQKNSLLDQIGQTFGGVIQNAKDTLSKNLGLLNNAKTDVTTGYDNQKTEQARLLGDTQRQNRQIARALGDSGSYYENLQSDAAANTSQNISQFNQREQSQLDNIGNEILSENTDTNTKIQQLNDQEAQQKTDVINKFADEYNQIQDSLNFNSKDKETALQGALANEQSALDNISYLMGQYKADAASAASTAANGSDVLSYLTGKKGLIPQLSSIDSSYKPIQNNQVLTQAIQSLQQDGSQNNYDNIVGYLNLYDATNGTNLSSVLPNIVKKQNTGGFLGIGTTPSYSVPSGLNTNTTSPMLDLIQNALTSNAGQ